MHALSCTPYFIVSVRKAGAVNFSSLATPCVDYSRGEKVTFHHLESSYGRKREFTTKQEMG
uniref:Uncharacterized protein n=1 Tax=Anguilla anguilla TaxID=7936 RepID=A0A0E9TE43_ANGAN